MRLPPRAWLAVLWVLAILAVAYLPDIGRGFVSDDFNWIYFSRAQDVDSLARQLVTAPTGFYRPMVSWSFAMNHGLAGLSPMPYALTNLLFVLIAMAAIVAVGRRWGLAPYAAVLAAALWALNFHGIGMALTWISGRTSLLAAAFAMLAGLATTSSRPFLAGVLTFAALLSKEEPVLLPLILASWVVLDRRVAGHAWPASVRVAIDATWPSGVALVLYLALRANTAAFTPWDAPEVYRLTLSPRLLVTNVLEYADRSSTLVVAVLVLGWVLCARRRITLTAAEWNMVKKGLAWLVLGFGATLFVPVRSDLYACFPSMGGVLAGGAVASALWRSIPRERQRLAAMALIALPVALLPIYRARNAPSREDAQLSARVVGEISNELYRHPGTARVVVYDRVEDRHSVTAVFRGMLPRAIELATGQTPVLEIQPLAGRPQDDTRDSADRLSFVFTTPAVN